MAGTAPTGATSASTTSSSPGSGGGDVKEQAQEKAQQVKEQATQQAHHVAGQVKSRVGTEVDRRSTEAGHQVSQQSSDLRSVAQQLRADGKDGPARMVDQVADRVERAGHWLTESDGQQILNDIEDFGRRNPWAVMAGGLTLGFLASRFLKASSRDRYEQRGFDGRRTADLQRQLPERAGYARPGSAPAGTGTIGDTPTTAPGTIGTGVTDPGERFTRSAGGATGPSAPPAGTGGIAD
jgi:gas vesicle protein